MARRRSSLGKMTVVEKEHHRLLRAFFCLIQSAHAGAPLQTGRTFVSTIWIKE